MHHQRVSALYAQDGHPWHESGAQEHGTLHKVSACSLSLHACIVAAGCSNFTQSLVFNSPETIIEACIDSFLDKVTHQH